jgi:phage head maturation protease
MPVPLVCDHHKLGQIGDVTLVSKYPDKIVIHGWVWDNPAADHAWALIQSGEMRALSVGATSTQKTVVDGVTYCDRWQLREVSIVRTPANPDCVFEIYRPKEL